MANNGAPSQYDALAPGFEFIDNGKSPMIYSAIYEPDRLRRNFVPKTRSGSPAQGSFPTVVMTSTVNLPRPPHRISSVIIYRRNPGLSFNSTANFDYFRPSRKAERSP